MKASKQGVKARATVNIVSLVSASGTCIFESWMSWMSFVEDTLLASNLAIPTSQSQQHCELLGPSLSLKSLSHSGSSLHIHLVSCALCR